MAKIVGEPNLEISGVSGINEATRGRYYLFIGETLCKRPPALQGFMCYRSRTSA